MAKHRLFFALSPAPAERRRLVQAAARIAAVQRAPGRPTPAAHLHLTLAFLGDCEDDDAVVRARQAGERVRATPFVLPIDQAASFGPTWFLGSVAPPPELAALQAALGSELAHAGFTLETREFHPHLTIQRKAEHALAPTRIAPIRWPVASFTLFESFPNERRYLQLASWPL